MESQPPHTGTGINASSGTPKSSTFGIVRRLTWTFVLLFLLLTVISAIAWYAMGPVKPRFRVSSISVSNFTVTDSELKGTFEIELNITNPNRKVEIMVDRFYVLVFYRSAGLSMAIVQQPIYLNKSSDTDVKLKFSLWDSFTTLAHQVVFHDLVNDWNKGIVNFDVKMLAPIVFEAGIWPSMEKVLDIYCGNLDIGFVPIKDTGKLLGIGKECQAKS